MKSVTWWGKGVAKQVLAWPLTRPMLFRRARHLGRWICATAGGDGVSSDPAVNGEEYVLENVLRSARPDAATIVEVGASRGDYVRMLAALRSTRDAPHIRYHGFEPGAEAFMVLQQKLDRSDLAPWTTVKCAAVGARVGTVTFHRVCGAGSELSSVHPQRVAGAIPHAIVPEEVNMTTIDAYAAEAEIRHMLFLKIDAEGNDRDVLLGARDMLQRGAIDFLQFEYNASWIDARAYLRDVFDLLLPAGYEIGKVRSRFVEHFSQWDYRMEWFEQANYVAWHRSVRPQFRVVTTERYLTTGN